MVKVRVDNVKQMLLYVNTCADNVQLNHMICFVNSVSYWSLWEELCSELQLHQQRHL